MFPLPQSYVNTAKWLSKSPALLSYKHSVIVGAPRKKMLPDARWLRFQPTAAMRFPTSHSGNAERKNSVHIPKQESSEVGRKYTPDSHSASRNGYNNKGGMLHSNDDVIRGLYTKCKKSVVRIRYAVCSVRHCLGLGTSYCFRLGIAYCLGLGCFLEAIDGIIFLEEHAKGLS